MSTPNLTIQYLVAGPCCSGNPAELKDRTIVLVRNQFFGLEATDGKQTLVMTDDNGVLRSLNNDFSFKPQPKQHLSNHPMHLSVVPNGVTRMTYFAVEQKWQKHLIEQINAANHKFLKTTPVVFSKKHLVVPEDSSLKEEKDAYNALGENDVCGQLIRKIRGVFIVFSAGYFVDGAVSAEVFDGKVQKVKILTSNKADPLTYVSSFNNETISRNYRLFYIDDIEFTFAEGKYRIEIGQKFLAKDLKDWCSRNGLKKISFIIEVKYSVHTLTGDFDFFQLDPLSLEESLLIQYPHRFSHIARNIIKEPSKTPEPNYEEYKTCLATWIERTEWFNAKRKMVTGFINGETDARIKTLGSKLIEAYTLLNKDNEELKKDAELLSGAWESAFAIMEARKSWDGYLDQLKVADSVKKIRQRLDQNWVSKTFHASRWQKYLLAHVGDENKAQLVVDLLDKGLTKEKTALLLKDGIPRETLSFDKAFMKTAGKALSALDTAMTVHQITNLISQRGKLDNDFEFNNKRFVAGTSAYLNKFGARANVQAITTLEVLRRTTDATRMKLDENAKELLQQSMDFVLGVLVCVPVIGEVAALIVAVKATVEAVGNYAATLGKTIDSKVLDDFFTDVKSVFDKLAELEGEYSINMDAVGDLLKSGKSENDPSVQFRLRAAILTGLLRLIDRCGSRLNDDAEFIKKFQQYHIREYIETFIIKPDSKVSITVQSDIPLDEIWLFCYGNKPGMGLAKVHRGFRFLKENAWALPAVVSTGAVGAAVSAAAKTVQLKFASRVPLSYQRMFPIHLRSSKDVLQLARLFSTNYSGVKKSNLVFGNVYVYVNNTWNEISAYKAKITPLDQIRVIVIISADNPNECLTGLPVSIQLVRTDPIPDVYGPVYKGIVQRLDKTENGGFDKGLLPEEAKKYPPNKHFGFILHPFYFFEDALFKGVKPCGSVYTFTNEMETKFILRVGDKTFDIRQGASKESEFKVDLPNISPIFNMKVRPDFVANKTSEVVLSPIFLPTSDVKVLGCLVMQQNKKWLFKSAATGALSHTTDFDFAWNKKMEIIFVFQTGVFHESATKKEAISFPVQVTAVEDLTLRENWETNSVSDTQGPSYPGTGLGYHAKRFYRGKEFVSSVTPVLYAMNILYQGERVANSGDVIDFEDAGALFAVRMKFAYSVEGENGEMSTYEYLKPFGKKYKSSLEKYSYYFKIDAPREIGMESVTVKTKFHFPGIPSPVPEMPFLASQKFVTGKSLQDKLEIQKVDYQ